MNHLVTGSVIMVNNSVTMVTSNIPVDCYYHEYESVDASCKPVDVADSKA